MNIHSFINNQNAPLVSVRVFNFNYGRYLKECFDSILKQSYTNIEICFSDNDSNDDSWDIAVDYQKRYPEQFSIARNRANFGPSANIKNCILASRGKYILNLCSDDVLDPSYVEKCVSVLERNPECAFVMVNRTVLNAEGEKIPEAPFYNKSCIIPGDEQAAVYMMAAVNPSISQVMYLYSKAAIHGASANNVLAGRWYGTRIMDFNLCCNFPVAYLKEPLLIHRIHGGNDSLNAARNLMEVIGPYILNYQFAETARGYNLTKVFQRLPMATEKLAHLCLRYCVRFLIEGNEEMAEQYFCLSAAISLKVKDDRVFKLIERYWECGTEERAGIKAVLVEESNLVTRAVSYEPPPGSVTIDV